MSEKRFTIKPQDDYWAVVDNHNEDKVCIINGIHTEIEAIWLCDFMNEQQDLIEELYDFRLTYNALLFNEWAENQKYEVYKSRRHNDGELCFDGEYFIVVAQLPTGQVTNHYHIRHWDMFKINEYEKVKEDFDGHTPSDVIERLQQVI